MTQLYTTEEAFGTQRALSQRGMSLTKEFEGFKPDIYKDDKGKRTIGYGFNIEEPHVRQLISNDVLIGNRPLSRQEADEIFPKLYEKAQKDAIDYVGEDVFGKLDDDIKDNLVDMSYQLGRNKLIGTDKIKGFTEMKKGLIAGDRLKISNEMKNSEWYKQSGRRGRHHVESTIGKRDILDLSMLNPFAVKEAEAGEQEFYTTEEAFGEEKTYTTEEAFGRGVPDPRESLSLMQKAMTSTPVDNVFEGIRKTVGVAQDFFTGAKEKLDLLEDQKTRSEISNWKEKNHELWKKFYGDMTEEDLFQKSKQEIESAKDIVRSAVSGAASQYTFGIVPPDEELAKKHPITYGAGQLTGGVASLMTVGGILSGAGLATQAAKAGQAALAVTKLGPRFVPRLIMTGATFGTHTAIQEAVDQANEGRLDVMEAGTQVAKDTAFGGLLGVAGGVASVPTAATIAAGLGFTSSKMDGAEDDEALLNGAIWGIFELVGSAGRDLKLRTEAVKNLKRSLADYAQAKKAMPRNEAENLAGQFIENEAAKVGGIDKVLESRENNLNFLENLNRNIFKKTQAIKPEVKAEATGEIPFEDMVKKEGEVAPVKPVEPIQESVEGAIKPSGEPVEAQPEKVEEQAAKPTKPQPEPILQGKQGIVEGGEKVEPILNNLNPTGSVFAKYSPKERMEMKLGENITTLDKTSNKPEYTSVTIFRGVPKGRKTIQPGDFVTTNEQLAKDYAGNGDVIAKAVHMRDVLDDKTEPLGEEYIYRPQKEVDTPKPEIIEPGESQEGKIPTGGAKKEKILNSGFAIRQEDNAFVVYNPYESVVGKAKTLEEAEKIAAELVKYGAKTTQPKELQKAVFKISKKASVWDVPVGPVTKKGVGKALQKTKKITSEKVQQIYQDTLTDIEFSEEGDFVVIKGYPKPESKMTAKEKKSLSSYATPKTEFQYVSPRTPDEFANMVDQLNKFAQGQAILRKGANLRVAAGYFVPIPQKGEVKISQESLQDDRVYMAVLAHELGHSIEYNVLGKNNDKNLGTFGKNLSPETIATLYKELRAVTEDISPGGLAGKLKVGDKYGAAYYNRPTELMARFFEKMLVSPGNLEEMAPTALRLLEEQSVKHPIIQEFLEAVNKSIDKGQLKTVLMRDFRQLHHKYLGKRAGDRAYGDIMVWRAMKERGKLAIEKLIESKFKGVKDSPDALFRSAESIKISRGGKPEFGTRDFVTAHNEDEENTFISFGYEKMPEPVIEDGKTYPQYAKVRYTPEEGRRYFNDLSQQGKKLVTDFTAERREAKDYFNREVIKDVNKIQGNIEGWVFHYFEDRPGSSTIFGSEKFKKRVAGTRKQRAGAEGYVEDFKKAMSKVMIDLEGEKAYNDFIKRYFARVTRPLAEGSDPISGWVEVTGTLQSGVGLLHEKRVTLIDKNTGEKIPVRQTRYQMPIPIYQRFKLWRELMDEATIGVRIVNDINRYWRVNILAHPGTAATNYVSGGIQYSAKVLTDFYKEVLTGDFKMPQTKQNISALVKVLLPKGWMNAPDWIYGGDLSNFYGQFMKQKSSVSAVIDEYGNKALKLFSLYERYWKKVILTADNVSDIASLTEMTPEGLRLPTEEERELIRQLNEDVDLYSYDYDNVPAWLEAHQKSAIGQAIKPFAKYPYKYAKQVLNMVESVFDGTLPWQDRVAKILALTTMAAAYAMFSDERKKKQKTPEAELNLEIPARLQTRGRLFIETDEEGNEIFMRVAKYPFINLTESGMQFVNGNWEGGKDLTSEMLGSIGPVAQIGLLAFNYRNKYQTYDSVPVILGESLATFTPGYRMLNDVSRMLDPFQRKQETFGQTFTKLIPTTDEALQEKLHGKIRMERVPEEGEITGAEGKRTTVDMALKSYWQDILISMLSGVYRTRIDPEVVEAYIIRKTKNLEKRKKKEAKEAENE